MEMCLLQVLGFPLNVQQRQTFQKNFSDWSYHDLYGFTDTWLVPMHKGSYSIVTILKFLIIFEQEVHIFNLHRAHQIMQLILEINDMNSELYFISHTFHSNMVSTQAAKKQCPVNAQHLRNACICQVLSQSLYIEDGNIYLILNGVVGCIIFNYINDT